MNATVEILEKFQRLTNSSECNSNNGIVIMVTTKWSVHCVPELE